MDIRYLNIFCFIDLKPRVAATLLPCLPAYIVFMCVRYTDMINNDIKVRSIIQSFLTATRKTIKKHGENLDYRALWLANMLRYFFCFCLYYYIL